MKNREFINKIEINPIIAAVKNDEGLATALTEDVEIIFVLYGDICTIPGIVKKIKQAGKVAMVHVDLITGLNNSKDVCLDFIKNNTEADGIITTKSNLIAHAKELELNTVLRYFILDSMALQNIEKQAKSPGVKPDIIEFLPGIVLPKMIKRINKVSRVPIIAGGLIADKEDVMNALDAGALAISTTNEMVWGL
ncbi:MAG: glycerol-3-phosphate responsive antiterminator [Butyrivibrio sp.]|uniref:glycerol-3-phosphate responsive antiterminator n=1 Tax=Butyrivibrio sp. TaxID=28121 RepID=UPI001B45286D|nr:glycerol-3-phosphate responsive antiterminator [Butyrivibrio sp.]MBP3279457.1 glycerol-3-phosphate responsive antiterminator [Butyrivibrio sp.]MBP3782440.1 glycerol-3-phosphate responsive antiterminator [Butyrivibrio sp.]